VQAPAQPINEAERLQALQELGLLDTAPEERFDRITRLAQRLFDVPIALVSLIDKDRQWFKSRQGLDATETPREVSFCGHAILDKDIFQVPDAHADPRFADNPLVTGAPKVRFYAGAPLSIDPQLRIGTLCLIDHEKRELNASEMATLRDLAALVEVAMGEDRRQRAMRHLAGHEAYLRAVLDTVHDAILSVDSEGRIRAFNRAAEDMFGRSAAQVLGHYADLLVAASERIPGQAFMSATSLAADSEEPSPDREVLGVRSTGEIFTADMRVHRMDLEGRLHHVCVLRDLSSSKQTEIQLHEASRWRQAILDSAAVAIIATTPDGLIQTFNRAAQQLLGYSEEEMVGRQTPAVLHDPDEVAARAQVLSGELGVTVEPGFETFIARARLGQSDENEWTYLTKRGERLTVLLSVTALFDTPERIHGYLGIARDISERKKIERLKSEFVATVSHELRTPLTSIRGALGAILGKRELELPDKIRRLLETANRNSERLTLLINDILDLEKIESGHLDFEFSPQNLNEICALAMAANEGYASQHDVKLTLQQAPERAEISGDEHRLMQVLANLLSNAIKFSPAGGTVQLSVQSSVPRYWRLSVRDYGRGIPEAFRERMFHRFAQADNSDARDKGGTGLGLSIVRAVVERHGGRISFNSKEGQGTEFFVDLPALAAVSLDTETSAQAPRVLICEDNADVAYVLAELVRENGYACDTVASAAAARSVLRTGNYAALLLDLKLPDGDGLSLIRELRDSDEHRSLPIVVVSGSAQSGQESSVGESFTVVDWLQKPVERERLTRALGLLGSGAHRARVLHVEDDADIIQVTQALIAGIADFDFARTLDEARIKLAEHSYDLAIIDVRMPDGSGLDLLGLLAPGCQVILFTGHEVDAVTGASVSAVLTKGRTSPDRLVATISQLLARRSVS
jgi:PAS domain S-box-containing protein